MFTISALSRISNAVGYGSATCMQQHDVVVAVWDGNDRHLAASSSTTCPLTNGSSMRTSRYEMLSSSTRSCRSICTSALFHQQCFAASDAMGWQACSSRLRSMLALRTVRYSSLPLLSTCSHRRGWLWNLIDPTSSLLGYSSCVQSKVTHVNQVGRFACSICSNARYQWVYNQALDERQGAHHGLSSRLSMPGCPLSFTGIGGRV